MTEDEARRIELVRAVELEDRDAVLLTREDREQADHRARNAALPLKGRKFERAFITARADLLAARLLSRHNGLADFVRKSRWPGWISVVVPLLALGAGVFANEFGTDKRMDLLAVPLLGTIAWNLLVYFWILVAGIRGILTRRATLGRSSTSPLNTFIAAIGRLGRRDDPDGTAIERAAATFRMRWTQLTAPLNAARAGRTLHLGAAMFAAGLIGGIYVRALVIEYRAGWESTFMGPEAVRAILAVVLGPASQLSQVAIPPLTDIAAMRWAGAETAGVNAAPWIHLYTLTVAGAIIAPRLLLALWEQLRVLRLGRSLPVAGRADFYIRRLLRSSGTSPGRARVTPYAYHPDEDTRRRLAATLKTVLGDGAEVVFDEAVGYGAEEEWAARHSVNDADDYHLVLFSLSTTPEAENHGELVRALTEETARRDKGQIIGALIDEGPYRTHFAGQTGLDERVETRLAQWRSMLAPLGILPIGIALSDAPGDVLAKNIEANLIRPEELNA
ncbi:DUF2868 domain-containing protein [Altererythrobacter confluentis]|uniref:DUF2868 domain-containing protein n=1 Tax=Allopontixanthobacter confluentis TaxID=1849021 RepID=A0A6L7GG52_9SPHN|nr:DUF2868 domain-containing protein [Allopontixanthobacter confluentis]MXP13651.1 DUF2868 domain-containing protein [Allopontixanthobacter confluentis]